MWNNVGEEREWETILKWITFFYAKKRTVHQHKSHKIKNKHFYILKLFNKNKPMRINFIPRMFLIWAEKWNVKITFI